MKPKPKNPPGLNYRQSGEELTNAGIPYVVSSTTNNNPVRRQPPVVVHNKGGQIYDDTRPSDWDKQRWK